VYDATAASYFFLSVYQKYFKPFTKPASVSHLDEAQKRQIN